jgi:ligand-binding sensor domain-containing protein/signal transduction histidine kinase
MWRSNSRQFIHRRYGFTALLLVIFTIQLRVSAQRLPFHNFSTDDGLVHAQATSLAQDKAGNLWVGTQGGVARYDGKDFTNFTTKNGLPANIVWAVAADSSGNVWTGTPSGLSQFNGKSAVLYPPPQKGTGGPNYTQQLQVAGDTIWWRAFGHVFFMTGGKMNSFDVTGIQGYVSSMLKEDSAMWVAKGSSIYHYAKGKWDSVKFSVPADQKAPDVLCMMRGSGGVLWIGTNAGLYKTEKGRLTVYPLSSADTSVTTPPSVFSIIQDKAGALWLGTNSGAIKISGYTVQYFNKKNGFTDKPVTNLYIDHENNVWLATDGSGIFRFSGSQFLSLDEPQGLSNTQVTSFATNKRDSIFYGTADAGLFIINDGKGSTLSFPVAPVPPVTSLCYTKSGKLWIGTKGKGLWSYAGDIFRQYEAPDRNFPSNFITAVHEDVSGRLWIGFSNGAILFEHDSFKVVGVNNAAVYSFRTIGADSTLIATGRKNGLLLYHSGEATNFQTNTALDNASVRCMMVRGAELWAGSSDNGLFRYNLDTHKLTTINKANGLRSDNIQNIIADNNGNIFAGTPTGIHKIRLNERDEAAVTFYGKTQGVTGMESSLNAVLKLPDGSILYGTSRGLLRYDPHGAVASPAPVSIVLQSVKLTGDSSMAAYSDSVNNWYGIPYHLHLPANKNSIAFTFKAISLSGGQQLYRYHLDGLETPWSDWSAETAVSYSALPPGKYVLRVQCRGDEEKNNLELSYPFEIITPIQQTAWFKLSILLLCVLAGVIIQHIAELRRNKKIRVLAALRLQEHNKIRLSTEEDFHGDINNKLARIKVLTGTLRNKIRLNADAEKLLGQIDENAAQLFDSSKEILWSLDPAHGNVYDLLEHIRNTGQKIFEKATTEFSFDNIDDRLRKYTLPMDRTRSLIMIFKEALDNCLKHSNAKHVWIEATLRRQHVLQLILRDDGEGFDMHGVARSVGLNSMQVRAAKMNGRLYIDSRKDKGTIITLTFKLTKK